MVACLLLHPIELGPGEALFLPAGELHAYLGGVGIELMGSSDNVLRGGLTSKHVDLPELLATLRFEPSIPRILRPRRLDSGEQVYETPARVFELGVFEAPFHRSELASVEILLAVSGQGAIRDAAGGALTLRGGDSVLVPAAAGGYRVDGSVRIYRAGIPR